ncbi:MAG: hypothetical protein C0483_25105 [Pirellula sp.]|nr:hypothetical protein [Pirellula sp.]
MRIILFTFTSTLAVCSSTLLGGAEPKKPETRELKDLPVVVTVKQRTSEVVPGSEGKLQVTIDDITRGQVIVSLSHRKHGLSIGPTSLRPDDTKLFKLGSESYQLRLKSLNNALLGDDFAELEFAPPPDASREKRRIETLIARIERMNDAAFIRQRREITPKEEAEFLRALWKEAGDEAATAERFVEFIDVTAKLAGDPYLVRLSDKTVVPAGGYLREQLRETPRKKKAE